MKTNNSPSERRQYFRISDTVKLEINLEPPLSTENGVYQGLSEIRDISSQTRHLYHQIANSQPHIAEYLLALDKKIDCLGSMITHKKQAKAASSRQNIQLSEGGFGSHFCKYYIPGSTVHIQMTLFPNKQTLSFSAAVIYCLKIELSDKTTYQTGFKFESLSSGDAQLIARHIIQKQSLDRKNSHKLKTQA